MNYFNDMKEVKSNEMKWSWVRWNEMAWRKRANDPDASLNWMNGHEMSGIMSDMSGWLHEMNDCAKWMRRN